MNKIRAGVVFVLVTVLFVASFPVTSSAYQYDFQGQNSITVYYRTSDNFVVGTKTINIYSSGYFYAGEFTGGITFSIPRTFTVHGNIKDWNYAAESAFVSFRSDILVPLESQVTNSGMFNAIVDESVSVYDIHISSAGTSINEGSAYWSEAFAAYVCMSNPWDDLSLSSNQQRYLQLAVTLEASLADVVKQLQDINDALTPSAEDLADVEAGAAAVGGALDKMDAAAGDASQKSDDAAGVIDEHDKVENGVVNTVDSITDSLDFSQSQSFLSGLAESLGDYSEGIRWWADFLGYALNFKPLAFMLYITVAVSLILLVLNSSLNFTFRAQHNEVVSRRQKSEADRRIRQKEEVRASIRASAENRKAMFDHYGYS